MAAPYSHRFIGGRFPAGVQATYTVPAGYVAIVRSVTIWNGSPGVNDLSVFVNGSWNIFSSPGVAIHQTVTLDTHQVLNPGDTIGVGSSAGTYDVTISGYLLSLAQ